MPTGQRKFAREDGKYADFLDTNSGNLKPDGTAFIGSSNLAAPSDHIHPLASGAQSLVASQVLAAPAANITFSGIPQTFSELRLLAVGASVYSIEGDRWTVSVNGDTGGHYDLQNIAGANASASASVKNAQGLWYIANFSPGDMPGASATAGVAGILEVIIPNYAGTTFQKVGKWYSGYSDAATAGADQIAVSATVAWRSTAAITSLKVAAGDGNLAAGTAAYLYVS